MVAARAAVDLLRTYWHQCMRSSYAPGQLDVLARRNFEPDQFQHPCGPVRCAHADVSSIIEIRIFGFLGAGSQNKLRANPPVQTGSTYALLARSRDGSCTLTRAAQNSTS